MNIAGEYCFRRKVSGVSACFKLMSRALLFFFVIWVVPFFLIDDAFGEKDKVRVYAIVEYYKCGEFSRTLSFGGCYYC